MNKEKTFAYIAGATALLNITINIINLIIAFFSTPESINFPPLVLLFWISLTALGIMLFMRKIHIGLVFPILWFVLEGPIAFFTSETYYRTFYSWVQTIGWAFMLVFVILAVRYKPGQTLEYLNTLAIIPCLFFAFSGVAEYWEYHMYEFRFSWGFFSFFVRSVLMQFIITLFMGLWIREKLKTISLTTVPTEQTQLPQ